MPDNQYSSDFTTSTRRLSDLDAAGGIGARTFVRHIAHELAADLTSDPIHDTVRVPASRYPSIIKITSSVITSSAKRMRSPEYVASIRRRHAQDVRSQISGLGAATGRDDFFVVIHPIVDRVRESIVYLQEFPTEGNAREIFRQIRDSMLDGQWESYKRDDVRSSVITAISPLAESVEVTPQDAFASADLLEGAGFRMECPEFIDAE